MSRLALFFLLCPLLLAAPSPAERAFAELKVLDTAGSPLRAPRFDWEGARRRAQTDPAWRAWLAERRRSLDEWMEKRRDRVEWVAGWYHDFVSPKDGSHLTWTPEPPGEWTLSSPSDPKVQLTPKLFAAWVYFFRSQHGSRMVDAAMMYRLTGEAKYAEWAAAELDFYAANYLRWPIQTAHNKSRLTHQSLDDATLLTQHLRAARLLGDWPAASRRTMWMEKLFRPTAELLNESMQRVHNIACWQRAAMAQAALFGQDEALWKLALDGPFGVRRQVRDGVTADYLWFEQSLGYNSYVVQSLAPLFSAAAEAGRMEELRHEMAVIENLMLSPISLRFPDNQLPNPADATGGLRKAPPRELMASMYRIFPTYIGLEAASRSRSWDTLVDPPPVVPGPLKPLPPVMSANLEASRIAILSAAPWQVFFHYGQLDSSHAQNEALNFEAFFDSTDVTHDPGTVGYGSPLHREFYTRGLAHNVPLVDGEGQARWQRGELISFSPAEVAARQPNYRPNASAERRLTIEGRKLVDRVTVFTNDGKPHRLGLVLHLQGALEEPAGFTPDAARFAEGYPPAFTRWDQLRSGGMARFRVRFGDRVLMVRIASPSGPLRVTVGTTPDVPPRRRTTIYVETEGREATFLTTIEP